jgi:hypothetical protein
VTARDRILAALQLELTLNAAAALEAAQALPDPGTVSAATLETAYLDAQRLGAIWTALGLAGVPAPQPSSRPSISLEALALEVGLNIAISDLSARAPVQRQAQIAASRLASYRAQGLLTRAAIARAANYAARWGTLQGVQDMADRSQALDADGKPLELLKTWVRLAARAERRNWHDALVGVTIPYSQSFEIIGPNGRYRVHRPYDPSLPLVETMRCGHGIRVEPPRDAGVRLWDGSDPPDRTPTPTPARARPTTRVPDGRSLAATITVPELPVFAPAARALGNVTRVHGDGALPAITISQDRVKKGVAAYVYDERTGRALGINVDPKKPWDELDIAHEIGHHLHQQVLSSHADYMGNEVSADLQAWHAAVRATPTFQRLERLRDDDFAMIRRGGRIVPVPNTASEARILLRVRELWARSYAQYIAISSGDSAMLDSVGALRDVSNDQQTLYPYQWQDEEFEPVAREVEALFARKGWMR